MTRKIAVSLPDELVDAARDAVEQGRAASVSAWVSAALAQHARTESLADLLADMDKELGPPTAESEAFADNALGLSRSS